ncbi:ATP-binding protein [Aestuariirhabdus sp. Z084]|uniref:sensor histidine kinase n=1 Tax=Aestuariirhabdus haliotis TaxID=2918751 RepID=UPI00201B4026|nr:PAS domain-containing sensor histidine kinase [Aestuariirhabdus haliotis]MCL6414458.1 ATP-binding protein [Aestuariirhabdus haliotis]MCL6418560.1 ATP-binding protein [Aestuariirhabdus haliotis]
MSTSINALGKRTTGPGVGRGPSIAQQSAVATGQAPTFTESIDRLMQPIQSKGELESAFEQFNEMSKQLAGSYRMLESRVETLQQELACESQQRLQELTQKEQLAGQLQSLLDLLPAGVVVLDGKGRVQRCNPASIELLGEPLEGELWRQVIDRCFAPQHHDGHEVSLKDGRLVSVSIRSLEHEPGQLILISDQTETRRLQQQLSRHERLSAMGKMVASLAHQIRTPLSAAMLYGGHLAEQQLDFERQQKFAGKLMSRLQNLEQQVRDMLIFARGELPLSDLIDVRQLVQEIRQGSEAVIISSGSSLKWTLGCKPGLQIYCNRDALVGAFQNLINNAVEAVGQNADITFSVKQNGGNLEIEVTDSGPGFDASTGQKMGEPFFSTKSKGTGLGIAVVRSIVRAHQGEFTIDSEPGEGACARVSLPVKAENESINLEAESNRETAL